MSDFLWEAPVGMQGEFDLSGDVVSDVPASVVDASDDQVDVSSFLVFLCFFFPKMEYMLVCRILPKKAKGGHI